MKREWKTVSAEEDPAAAEVRDIMVKILDAFDVNDFRVVMALFNLAVKALNEHGYGESDIADFVHNMHAADHNKSQN